MSDHCQTFATTPADPALTTRDRRSIEDFHRRLREVLGEFLPIPDFDLGALRPRELALSPEARSFLTRKANEIEAELAPGGAFEGVSAHASKTCEQACRIVAVLTLWRDPRATEVASEDMERGYLLAHYCLVEARRLTGVAGADTDLVLADALRTWLLARPARQFLIADVQQRAPRREMRSRATATRLLGILEEHGWIRALPVGAVIGGVPRKNAWTVV